MALYYKGPGVLTSGGKDYGVGDKLPETLSEDLINSLQRRGRISDVAPKKLQPTNITVGELAEINSRLQERLKFVEEEAAKAIASRDKQIDEANKTIEALTAQLTSTSPSAGAVSAGPVKKKHQ